MNNSNTLFIIFFCFFSAFGQEPNDGFAVAGANRAATIVYDEKGSSLDSISAYLLAEDIARVTGKKPAVTLNARNVKGNLIIIGNLRSNLVRSFIKIEDLPSEFQNQKESFFHKKTSKPGSQEGQVLIIAGTDPRGTAYGVFDLSKKIGVSPWYWWADVPVEKKEEIILKEPRFFSKEPSVEFRGIFLNDEDWGLQPWAAKTFEPEVEDIGPKTYAKIFELLLRLKANTIWPAMHPSTKAFFHYPGNPKMAEKYHIVVGSSHAEPMLRNNVDEWKKDLHGDFNYITNKEKVYDYWEERIEESSQLDAIYTVGMRGIHDSGMEGAESTEEAAEVLSNVIKDQRNLLRKYNEEELPEIPQAFTVYKEVLELYDSGMEIPDDITIIWTDDNYGYIRRLSNEEERRRDGGGGVYYHASYWGRPHDYLWLSSTHPALIRDEMMKAYKTDSKKIWILNVGDIKPAEYDMQLFLDMAYDASKFEDPEYVTQHLKSFCNSVFGEDYGEEIADLKMDYYRLAFERKPEFMGWSQTEPTTQTDTTAYNPFYWGDEISNRLSSYEELEARAEKIGRELAPKYQDALFQLVLYPVKGASFMNKKFLYRDLAIKYDQQERFDVRKYRDLSTQYYDSIVDLTKEYNQEIANGKWKHMMDMQPRRLPVYQKPEISLKSSESENEPSARIAVENQKNSKDLTLPVFYSGFSEAHFFDIFLTQPKKITWKIKSAPKWVILDKSGGFLTGNHASERIDVRIDWEEWRKSKKPERINIQVSVGKKVYNIPLKVRSYELPSSSENTFVEKNGIVSIYAKNFSSKKDRKEFRWQKLPHLGYSNDLMQALPFTKEPLDTSNLEGSAPYLEYIIHTETNTDKVRLLLNALPTHPITTEHGVRVGVQWNNGPVEIVDFRTYGRSEEWKQNVLRNLARVSLPLRVHPSGKQNLKIYMVDQGVSLDYIYLILKDVPVPFSLLPETRFHGR